MATGIDGVWNDMNEPTAFEQSENTMPLNNVHIGENRALRTGKNDNAFSHLRFHNVYGMQMVRASRD
jgi:alpha-glucosidase